MGPYAHMVLAGRHAAPLLEAMGLELGPRETAALLMGSIAPDAGYYPGAETRLADSAHRQEPWRLAAAMRDLARSPAERAFALGWLSHLAADMRGHHDLVNPLADNGLAHERLEWGLDCHLLELAQYAWLWTPKLDARGPVRLWAKALREAHTWQAPESLMLRALTTEKINIALIAWLELFCGHTRPKHHRIWNRLGRFSEAPLRSSLMAVCRGFHLGVSIKAVLSPRPPGSRTLQGWEALYERHGGDLISALAGNDPGRGPVV